MSFYTKRAALVLIAVFAAACSNNGAVPSTQGGVPFGVSQTSADSAVPLVDHTSILKKLTKDVVIGSTVDPGNGDTGPHGISVVQTNYGLKKGQVITCNFADSGGAAGKGTTADLIDPKTGKTTTLVQSSKIEGCAGDATTLENSVWAAGYTAGQVCGFEKNGNSIGCNGSPFSAPFSVADAHCKPGPHCLYSAEIIFGSDAKTGGIVSFAVNNYGNPNPTEVVTGFAVNKKSGWSILGPSGLSYNPNKLGTLYAADGVNNTVVALTNASNLLAKDEVVVLKGGKTFRCKYHSGQAPCGKLIFAGSPLNAPVGMTILPNGNLIVANSKGGNTLIEIDVSTGKVLATKVVDKSKKQGIFALQAIGTKDTNTALYYTDKNDNNLHELEQ
jgi:hypothetical protein